MYQLSDTCPTFDEEAELPILAIFTGLPGSGKSTVARELKTNRRFYVISSDAIRLALNAGVYPRELNGEYQQLEPVTWELVGLGVRRLLEDGQNVGVDATNLTKFERARWRNFAREVCPDVRVEIHWCIGQWDSAERWRTERGLSTEEYQSVRAKREAVFEEPTADESDELVIHGKNCNLSGS